MAKQQQPFGGAPRVGNAAPGEPADSPVAAAFGGFGGAPTQHGHYNRGVEAINPDPSSAVFPEVYGGGNAQVTRPNQKKVSGSGDGTGAGTTTGTQVP